MSSSINLINFYINISLGATEEDIRTIITNMGICVIKEVNIQKFKTSAKVSVIVEQWLPRGKSTMEDLTRGTPFTIWHKRPKEPAWLAYLEKAIIIPH